jgi:hypothetical protein
MSPPIQERDRNQRDRGAAPDAAPAQEIPDVDLGGEKEDLQALEALKSAAREQLQNFSDRDIQLLAEQGAFLGTVDKNTASELQSSCGQSRQAQEKLRDEVRKSILTDLEGKDLSAEDIQAKMEKIFGQASQEQLERMFRKVGGESAEMPADRDSLIKALSTREAVEKLTSDPSLSANLAHLLLESGTLSVEQRTRLEGALSQVQDTMRKLRETLAGAVAITALRQYRAELGRGGVDRNAGASDAATANGSDQSPTARPGKLDDILRGTDYRYDQFKVEQRILFDVEEAIRQKEKREDIIKEASLRDERLQHAIDALKREKGELMKGMPGIHLTQTDFQSPFEHPVKPFTNGSLSDGTGEVYLFNEFAEEQRVEEARKRDAAKAA